MEAPAEISDHDMVRRIAEIAGAAEHRRDSARLRTALRPAAVERGPERPASTRLRPAAPHPHLTDPSRWPAVGTLPDASATASHGYRPDPPTADPVGPS